ncbi:MAG: putative molybdenum carrier protein [Pirellulales bacterium]|nr:putative molybdenum carrier protein [Pirellulales bacterium]
MPREPNARETLPGKIVSGGQTGVDRAALDVALAGGIPHGGWCPRGRLAEDGPIPARYELRETSSAEYAVRTERNVLDSDGTLILHAGPLRGGTLLTCQLAERHEKPYLTIDLAESLNPSEVVRWLLAHKIDVLNIAGPRASQSPGIAQRAEAFLKQVFGIA